MEGVGGSTRNLKTATDLSKFIEGYQRIKYFLLDLRGCILWPAFCHLPISLPYKDTTFSWCSLVEAFKAIGKCLNLWALELRGLQIPLADGFGAVLKSLT